MRYYKKCDILALFFLFVHRRPREIKKKLGRKYKSITSVILFLKNFMVHWGVKEERLLPSDRRDFAGYWHDVPAIYRAKETSLLSDEEIECSEIFHAEFFWMKVLFFKLQVFGKFFKMRGMDILLLFVSRECCNENQLSENSSVVVSSSFSKNGISIQRIYCKSMLLKIYVGITFRFLLQTRLSNFLKTYKCNIFFICTENFYINVKLKQKVKNIRYSFWSL